MLGLGESLKGVLLLGIGGLVESDEVVEEVGQLFEVLDVEDREVVLVEDVLAVDGGGRRHGISLTVV